MSRQRSHEYALRPISNPFTHVRPQVMSAVRSTGQQRGGRRRQRQHVDWLILLDVRELKLMVVRMQQHNFTPGSACPVACADDLCLKYIYSASLGPDVERTSTHHPTSGKDHFTLAKYFIDKLFFAEYFFRHLKKILPSVEQHSAKKNTQQIKKTKKNSKHFLKIYVNKCHPFLPFFNQIFMFCEWWDLQPLSLT